MSQFTPPSPYPAPGEVIGESWQVEKILGEGGMGAVARAWDLILHTPVAIKFMNPQFLALPGAEERFINEGKASALIKSDHVVPVMKAGRTQNGTPYLVMECLEGLDLADLLARDGRPGLPIERAVHFVLQVLRALQAAHAIGIIHRDMKPSNCFAVNKDGEDDFVKILDFGISKIQQPEGGASLTQTNSALGTPLYMSPEQARRPRDVDRRTDIYSVGVILYELLTGRTPFFSETGEFTELLFKLFTADPPHIKTVRPDLPDTLAAAVHKALARDVDQRFGSAVEMADALAPFAGQRSEHVLDRMRAFKGPSGSIAPPQDLPQSMVAFSQLQHSHLLHGVPTGLEGGTPGEGVRPAVLTEMLPRPLDGGVSLPARLIASGAEQTGAAGPRHSAAPAAPEARALPSEGSARTQFDPTSIRPAPLRAFVPGASTDLSTARDTSVMGPRDGTEAKRSRMVVAIPLLALLVIGGVGIGLFRSGDHRPEGTLSREPPFAPSAAPAPTRPSETALALPPLTATAGPDTSAAPAAMASASASSPRLAPPPRAPAPHPGTPTPPGPGTSVLDTNIKQ